MDDQALVEGSVVFKDEDDPATKDRRQPQHKGIAKAVRLHGPSTSAQSDRLSSALWWGTCRAAGRALRSQ